MATSFRVLHPDIQISALSWTTDRAFEEDFSIENTFDGNRRVACRLQTSTTDLVITFDLGVGSTRTLDYIAFGGASQLVSSTRTMKVEIKANYASPWVTTIDNYSFDPINLLGRNLDEFVFTTDNTDPAKVFPAQLFRVTLSGTPSIFHVFDRMYLGQSFDFGKEPDDYNLVLNIENEGDTWLYPRGHAVMSKAFYPKHQITIEYDGITDERTNALFKTLLKNPYGSPVYLYTKSYTDPLYDNRLMLCKIMSDQCVITKPNDVKNWNNVVMVFGEV